MPELEGDALTAYEDKAIEEALAGRGEQLYACLESSLNSSISKKRVKDLFQRYSDAYAASVLRSAESSANTKDQKPASDVESGKMDTNLSRAMLCAITAHAVDNSFRPLLKAYLSLGAPEIPSDIRQEHLDALRNTSAHDKVLAFCRELATVHLIANPNNLAKYLTSLSKASMSRGLQRLYDGVMDKIRGPTPFIAATEELRSSSLPLAMQDSIWASFISAFVRCQRGDLAQQVFEDLIKLGVRPGTATWTARLNTFHHQRLLQSALECWDEMTAAGVEPDAVTYTRMISLLFSEKEAHQALQLFAEFQGKEKKFDPAQVLLLYNAVVEGFLRNRLVPQAQQFIQMMRTRGPSPDVVTFNTLLAYYARRLDFNGILSTMGMMEEVGVKGDVYSFSTILSSLLKAGRKDAIDVVLECMRENGVQANVAIYSALIDDQLRKGDQTHWRAAMALLSTMEENERLSPNNVTYTTILAHLHRPNRLDPATQKNYWNSVLQRMRERQVWFTLPDYHILIKACFDDQTEAGTAMALRYYQEIKNRNIPRVSTTFYILLAGLIQNGELRKAREIVKDIDIIADSIDLVVNDTCSEPHSSTSVMNELVLL